MFELLGRLWTAVTGGSAKPEKDAIQAKAKAKQVLEDFVKTYRDPSYSVSAEHVVLQDIHVFHSLILHEV